MFSLIRKNKHPTCLRELVKAVYRQRAAVPPHQGSFPSHHILCAGTYSPVFARLAAESALASCPVHLRSEFKLYIHVDGLDRRMRPDLLAWLKEIPGVEITYGLFGVLPGDRIPGKWHQVMINDVVRLFSNEPNIVFLDADFFLLDTAWFRTLSAGIAQQVYTISVGTRDYAYYQQGSQFYRAIKTQLFSVNSRLHESLNLQHSNKDLRAFRALRREFPNIEFHIARPDTMIATSLRAQAHGYQVLDVEAQIEHCHVGGFSHMGYNKFHDHRDPARHQIIVDLVGRARLLSSVLNYFDLLGWGRFVDPSYRINEARMRSFIQEDDSLLRMCKEIEPTGHEKAFERLVMQRETGQLLTVA